ncbi:MAG: 3-oxoacyl-[acyl-carrier protein] reductase [uncultured Blastococcus sp.]|uniref:3-oxoacyl-[acyl-carrier protein] reductase n=1 Tax=uncultured Blastococcus sp. TaxID=217144 RepID=A0A6J4IT17_9ACTN|nr:MAG: 3-oxoacyl-[acyl-carrier protein] reductase [uncultured Blastococcus sp.]
MPSSTGTIAIVTGASRGIGRAIAQRLAADGSKVIVHFGADAAAADETVRSIVAAGGEARPIAADLRDLTQVDRLLADVDAHEGRIDILVNNAGFSFSGEMDTITPEIFDRLVETNFRGPFFLTQGALRTMSDGGRIINISSVSTRVAMPRACAYGPTKAAMQNVTLSLAEALGPRGITVNSVVPGVYDTDMTADWLDEEARQRISSLTAHGRIGQVSDIVGLVAFLASEESGWVTAQIIEASGGLRL